MAIIVVGGSNRGVGKTALVCGLIAVLPDYRWTAVKITTHNHQQPVSPGRENIAEGPAADAPHPLRAPFFRQIFERRSGETAGAPESAPANRPIWEETTPGDETDTARYLAAGAARALLVSVPDGELAERRAALAADPPSRPVEVGWLSVYQRLVRPLPEGAVLRPRRTAS